MKSALVTGGAGFVGSHLVRRLLERGVRTHVVVRKGSGLQRLAPAGAQLRIDEISSNDDLSGCVANASPDIVFHLASQTRAHTNSAIDDAAGRVTGDLGFLLATVKAAATAPKPPAAFVRAASLAEYGAAPAPYHEADRLQPLTPYGASMAACTQMLGALQQSLPFRVAQGRLALVYGPGQSTAFLVAKMIADLSAGRAVEVRNPAARRDLIFVDDAVSGLIALAERDTGLNTVLNLCTGVGISMREAAETVLAATGASPSLVRYGSAPARDGAQDLWGSPALAAGALQWRATTDFKDGVRLTIDRMAKEGAAQGLSR
jgi:nucleoside-diphosphate-sugar epimerase